MTTQAADGAEAVALACELEFDLILMGLDMPLLGGVEATRQIRDFELPSLWARVPIVACAPALVRLDEKSLLMRGMNQVLLVSHAVADLSDCLQRWWSLPRVSKRELTRSSSAV